MPVVFTRRKLLAMAAAGGCAVAASRLLNHYHEARNDSATHTSSSNPDPSLPSRFWQGTSQYDKSDQREKYFAFKVGDDGSNYTAVECRTNAHSIQSIPHSNKSIAISRRLSSLSVVDWDLKKETLFVSLPEGQTFYGHGVPLYTDKVFTEKYAISGAIYDPEKKTSSTAIHIPLGPYLSEAG